MKDKNDLSKGSGSLYGEDDLIGKIKNVNDGQTIKKAEDKDDELEKKKKKDKE